MGGMSMHPAERCDRCGESFGGIVATVPRRDADGNVTGTKRLHVGCGGELVIPAHLTTRNATISDGVVIGGAVTAVTVTSGRA